MNPPLCLHVFATFQAAGPQVRTVDLIRAFGGAYRHRILPMDGRAEAAGLLPGGVDAKVLEPPPKAGSARTAWRLAGRLSELRPDLLLTYNFGAVDALLAARWKGAPPAIHHEDGFGPDEAAGYKRRRVWLRRLALPAAARVVVVSAGLEAAALGPWRQARSKVVRIPNGIETARFEHLAGPGAELRAKLGIGPEQVAVGTVGHLRPEKNQARLLEAAALALEAGAPLHLIVVGDGPERAALAASPAARRLGARLHWLGHLPDPRPVYWALDLFALSSDTEQMPISLLEAMAAGRAALSTDVGDVRAMLGPEAHDCVVAPGPGAASALARCLAALAADPDRRAWLGDHNRARARTEYDQERMVAAYGRLYAEVLGRGA